MEFEPVNNHFNPVFRRLLVDKKAAQFVTGRYLLEARTRLEDGDDSSPNYDVHPNLIVSESDLTVKEAPSRIWQDRTLKSFGKEGNMHPRLRQRVSYDAYLGPSKAKLGANHYIAKDKAARIAGWTNKIDEEASADPYTAVPEPSAEQTATRRRKVAVDSDDEDADDKSRSSQLVLREQGETDQDPEQPTGDADRFVAQLNLLPTQLSNFGAALSPEHNLADDSRTTTDMFFPNPEKSIRLGSPLGSDLLQMAEIHSTAPISGLPRVPKVRAAVPDVAREASYTQRCVLGDSDSEAVSNEETSHVGTARNEAPLTLPGADIALDAKSTTLISVLETFDDKRGDTATDETQDQWQTVVASKKVQAKRANYKVPKAISHLDGAHITPSDRSPDDKSSITDAAGLATTLSWPSKGFDPNAYGPTRSGSKESKSSAATSPDGNFATKPSPHVFQSESSHTLHGTNQVQPGRFRGSYFRGRGRFTTSGRSDVSSADGLIDVSDNTPFKPAVPPPGLNIKVPQLAEEPVRSPEEPSLLDSPVDFDDRPSNRDARSDLISFSSASRPTDYSNQSAHYVNDRPYKGPNIKAIKNQHLAKLYAMEAEQQQKKVAAQEPQRRIRGARKPRKAVDEDYKNSFHSTMSQKAGNPGKKGGKSGRGGSSVGRKNKSETVAERQERLATAMKEAYGSIQTSPTTTSPEKPRVQNLTDMSAKKRSLLATNQTMATANAEALEHSSRQQAVADLILQLTPVFEAARAFSGDLNFSFQLGQVLISYDSQIIHGKVYSLKGWNRLFGAAAKVAPPLTTFTNRITTNGAEVDRALDIQQGAGQVWDQANPARDQVTYNFHCQSKHGTDFWLLLNEDGSHSVRHSETVIGQVAIHVPGQVWDACAVLKGRENWEEPPSLITDAVIAFLETVYVVPNRRELVLTFRHPANNEITVTDVFIERTSHHQCLLPYHQNYEIQVTEAKELYNKVHPQDRKLWQVYEKSYLEMVADGQVHYELSIADRETNEAFITNKSLEIGSMSPASSTGKSLLKPERMLQMVNLTAEMLIKINWLGAQNDGTLLRGARFQQEQQIRQQQSLPPMARSRINQIFPASRMNSRAGGSTVTGGLGASETYLGVRTIHGTRARTQAEVYEDEFGNRYAKGMGGARIPVPDQSLTGAGNLGVIDDSGEVVPDDSASQVGVRKVKTAMGGRSRGMHDDKPPGFW